MRLKPPFYPQETPDSCVPACLRMVLSGLGFVIKESELRRLCDCTIFGTEAFQAVKAARQLGFQANKINLTVDQLNELVGKGRFPIVYVGLTPFNQGYGTHALVVIEVSGAQVSVLDPLQGVRCFQQAAFDAAFKLTNGLTIVVEGESET